MRPWMRGKSIYARDMSLWGGSIRAAVTMRYMGLAYATIDRATTNESQLRVFLSKWHGPHCYYTTPAEITPLRFHATIARMVDTAKRTGGFGVIADTEGWSNQNALRAALFWARDYCTSWDVSFMATTFPQDDHGPLPGPDNAHIVASSGQSSPQVYDRENTLGNEYPARAINQWREWAPGRGKGMVFPSLAMWNKTVTQMRAYLASIPPVPGAIFWGTETAFRNVEIQKCVKGYRPTYKFFDGENVP